MTFSIRLDVKPDNWEDRLVLFVGFLIEDGKKSSTIKSYISAIKSVLKKDGVEISENKYLLGSLTKACKYVNDQVYVRLPIQKGLLNLILKEIEQLFEERNQVYLKNLYLALFSTAYYGLFRIGEVAEGTHTIKARDVHVGDNKQKMLFILRTSKTHWSDSKPQTVKIVSTKLPYQCFRVKGSGHLNQFCPFTLLRNYMAIRETYHSRAEHFFVFRDRAPVPQQQVRDLLRISLDKCGVDSKLYGFHSFRAGRSVDLYHLGLDVSTIQKIGRWRSNSVYQYLKC